MIETDPSIRYIVTIPGILRNIFTTITCILLRIDNIVDILRDKILLVKTITTSFR